MTSSSASVRVDVIGCSGLPRFAGSRGPSGGIGSWTPSRTHSPLPPSDDLTGPLSDPELAALDAWWRAADYLSVGPIYLMNNPLLREPLRSEHVKPRLLGHWELPAQRTR